jgi:hypothetical protein
MAAFGASDSCPNCGARMAADQRYCLNCGHRRGEPRLPFMDAVVFMETMNAPGGTAGSPPPPPPAQSGGSNNRWNANAALIAGVATLVLAIGVGFLIGRTGHENSGAPTGGGEVKVVQVGGAPAAGGTEEAATPEASTEATTGGKTGNEAKAGGESKSKGGAKPKASEVEEGSKEEEKLAEEKTAETLHANGPLAKPKAQVGETCEKGTPGCSTGGEFNGNFFGE